MKTSKELADGAFVARVGERVGVRARGERREDQRYARDVDEAPVHLILHYGGDVQAWWRRDGAGAKQLQVKTR